MVTKTIDISGGVVSQLAWDDVNTNVLLNGWLYPFCITISDWLWSDEDRFDEPTQTIEHHCSEYRFGNGRWKCKYEIAICHGHRITTITRTTDSPHYVFVYLLHHMYICRNEEGKRIGKYCGQTRIIENWINKSVFWLVLLDSFTRTFIDWGTNDQMFIKVMVTDTWPISYRYIKLNSMHRLPRESSLVDEGEQCPWNMHEQMQSVLTTIHPCHLPPYASRASSVVSNSAATSAVAPMNPNEMSSVVVVFGCQVTVGGCRQVSTRNCTRE